MPQTKTTAQTLCEPVEMYFKNSQEPLYPQIYRKNACSPEWAPWSSTGFCIYRQTPKQCGHNLWGITHKIPIFHDQIHEPHRPLQTRSLLDEFLRGQGISRRRRGHTAEGLRRAVWPVSSAPNMGVSPIELVSQASKMWISPRETRMKITNMWIYRAKLMIQPWNTREEVLRAWIHMASTSMHLPSFSYGLFNGSDPHIHQLTNGKRTSMEKYPVFQE